MGLDAEIALIVRELGEQSYLDLAALPLDQPLAIARPAPPAYGSVSPGYMVHVNTDDGSRVFMPYTGGLARFNETYRGIAVGGFRGFVFQTAGDARP